MGLTSPRIGPKAANPRDFHRYVSSDPTVAVGGTDLPQPGAGGGWDAVVTAVCAVTRCEPADLRSRGAPRTLALRLAWYRGLHDVALLADRTDLSPSRVFATVATVPPAGALLDPALLAATTVLGDGRFI